MNSTLRIACTLELNSWRQDVFFLPQSSPGREMSSGCGDAHKFQAESIDCVSLVSERSFSLQQERALTVVCAYAMNIGLNYPTFLDSLESVLEIVDI